ncbi:4-hydroxyphenylpyruvate dioxygenase [Archangium sp.]|uniref:4-hydroxyphenylpyruvate dioxygenase n=1 Tax=Archangium sp. TaxID=1872627 RepID=UPI002D4CC242|nr:4-hydroxyphenylpyruvate dioxygenase [Archangium sp.]HYO54055.1 4-hydroxyphenylpyruvate dioxygenase [Archangium sp.]
MKLKSIDHIELYVGDARKLAHFYSSTFGFRVVAESGPGTGVEGQCSYLLQQGTMWMVLTSALTPRNPVAEYVERHGDGVKDIAFLTANAAEAFEEAVRCGAQPVREPMVYKGNGAQVVQATVAAPMGDLLHTFIQREGREGVFMPGLFRETYDFGVPAVEPFAALDHIAICLEPGTLARTARFYADVFGFRETHEENVRSEYSGMNSKVIESPNGRITFPMMEPAVVNARRQGQIEEFLTSHGGPGVQHLAMLSNDIAAAIRAMRTRQVEFLDIPGAYYDMLEGRVGKLDMDMSLLRELGILADRDASGILLQVFTRSTHPRRTLFFEVVQRLNACGFGGGNIRALFDAKEREQDRAV